MTYTPTPQPGIYPDVPEHEYRAWDAMNYSRLKLLSRSVEEFDWYEKHPKEATKEMRFGRVVDALLHEPLTFSERFHVMPKVDGRTKAGKEALAAAAESIDKEIVRAEDMQRATAIVEAVRGHRKAAELYAKGKPQVCVVWVDRETGVTCKARIDWLTEQFIADLKTTSDIEPVGFAKQMYSLGYHIQNAFYQDGLFAVTGKRLPFVIVAVASEPPHIVKVFMPDRYTLDCGRIAYRRGLYSYSLCRKSGEWKDSQVIEDIQLPAWALREEGIQIEREEILV